MESILYKSGRVQYSSRFSHVVGDPKGEETDPNKPKCVKEGCKQIGHRDCTGSFCFNCCKDMLDTFRVVPFVRFVGRLRSDV